MTASLAPTELRHSVVREQAALLALRLLRDSGYSFTAPTPATHRRYLRTRDRGQDVRDALGWTLPFAREALTPALLEALDAAGFLVREGGLFRATVRVSSLGDDLFIHSAFPASGCDAVFFGPDSYRFAGFIREQLRGETIGLVVDIGAGSGVGAVAAARACNASRVLALDINPVALDIAKLNFAAAGRDVETRLSDGLAGLTEEADIIVANPPFIAGVSGRAYRDGGDMLGARLALQWAQSAADKLTPGGRFLLYTGSAIVGGVDGFHATLKSSLDLKRCTLAYRELDPDIFGGLVGSGDYASVERIAAVGAVITRY